MLQPIRHALQAMKVPKSVRWRMIASVVCVCSTLHMRELTSMFVWRSGAAPLLVCLNATLIRHCFSLMTPTFGSLHFTSPELDKGPVQIVEDMMVAHGLILQNPLDQPTHRCGVALGVILTSPYRRSSAIFPLSSSTFEAWILAARH